MLTEGVIAMKKAYTCGPMCFSGFNGPVGALNIIMWRTEDRARRGKQVLIAYFLGFEQQCVVFAKCSASSCSVAGLNWSLLLAAGNMQIKMPFGNLWNIVPQLRGPCASVKCWFGASTKVNAN